MTAPPRQHGLKIENWKGTNFPTLNGRRLPLRQYESSRSLAIHPKGDRFVLGADWSLRAFDATGKLLWEQPVPGAVWAVNITGDGRMAVAAYSDGTIRWHRMDDGRELLAFFPLANKTDWVAWTPEGFYGATPGAHGVLQWHVNRGWDAAASTIALADIREARQPEALKIALHEGDIMRAIGLATYKRMRDDVQLRARSKLPPGAKLHFVSVGISGYGKNAAHLALKYAAKDARDIAAALTHTQTSLYAQILPQVLTDNDASRRGILDALIAMAKDLRAGGGRDVGVFSFSGHGALIGGEYYLLPHDADARSADDITTTALSVSDLRKVLSRLGRHGRILVLLDACNSGSATVGGDALRVNGGVLRTALAGLSNVTVLTSSGTADPSYEHVEWGNGAFTEAFLQALGSKGDTDRNSLISMSELQDYITRHLPSITSRTLPKKKDGSPRAQTPGMEVRFQAELFVSRL